MSARTIAIADIHGCSAALAAIINAIDPQAEDRVFLLGDYCDVGHDTKGVFDLLIELRCRCHLVAVAGNHDELMLNARKSKAAFRRWMEFGGLTTLDSFGDTGRISLIPAAHFEFLASCVSYHETATHIFLHAGYDPARPLDEQDGHTLRWRFLADGIPSPHLSNKIAVVGHSPQPDIVDAGHIVLLDTGCGYGGRLSALELGTGQLWQADERGQTWARRH